MRPPRRLSSEEAAIWRQVAATVTPLVKRLPKQDMEVKREEVGLAPSPPPAKRKGRVPPAPIAAPPSPTPRASPDKAGLDGSWDRRLAKGVLEPDFSLDLHGAGLDAAYVRLMRGLTQAKAMGARVVLVVTGKPRPVEAADRGRARGAIRAKIGDWLTASEHAGDIAAVRGAHRRHGGAGALYVILKKRR